MSDLLDNALTQLISLVGTLPDMKIAYPEPPEMVEDDLFPCSIIYPFQGIIAPVVADRRVIGETHTINVDIHQVRVIHPSAFTAVRVWPSRMGNMLRANQTLNNSIKIIQWPLTYEAVEMPYGREIHYGMRFSVTVRIY